MSVVRLISACLLAAGLCAAPAQSQPIGQPPAAAPGKPYKPVAITPPPPLADAGFDALRKQIGEATQRKDRAALAALVVGHGFFWQREGRNRADKRKSGIDNLSTALGLNNKQGAGWDILTGYAEDSTASPSPIHKGAVCAPAEPAYNAEAFAALIKTTQTDISEWGFPVSDGIAVHVTPQANAPVIEKLPLAFVLVSPERNSTSAAYLRIITPDGKAGFVSVDAIAPIGNDRICYVKDDGGWKIGGYIGGGEPP